MSQPDWNDLDDAYLLIFGEHTDLDTPEPPKT